MNVPAHVELRRMRRSERWLGILVPRLARRVASGKSPQPGWLPRRWLTVVSGDADLDAGIGALWLEWRPRSVKGETHTALVERCGGQWQHTGGGSSGPGVDVVMARSSAGQPGQVGMIELGGCVGRQSYACRSQHPRPAGTALWVGASELRVAAEASRLLLGERRIPVPGDGRLIVAWKSHFMGHGRLRPVIVAVDRDGSELSRIGPDDSMDSYTWAKLSS